MSRDTYPESEPQHCTQSLDPFARCSSTCTSRRSPNWWNVSWPQVPIPSWMSKSNRATVNGDEREQHQDSDGRNTKDSNLIPAPEEIRCADENADACEDHQFLENVITSPTQGRTTRTKSGYALTHAEFTFGKTGRNHHSQHSEKSPATKQTYEEHRKFRNMARKQNKR